MTQVPVGSLHCQKDTYCKEFYSTCISCTEKPDKKGFYQVKLIDTILFPEGGGQPSDEGYFNDTIKVYKVERKLLEHIHYTKEPIQVNSEVKITLDWERRWDHVQQHSGQHLVSAILEQPEPNSEEYLETIGWCMKEKVSYIELDTSSKKNQSILTRDFLNQKEKEMNDFIIKAIPVTCHTNAVEEGENRPTNLPDDYKGEQAILRTIEIQGIDKNPCCGTHVAHLGHLQSIKLLQTESIRGGNTRLYFIVGQRCIDTLNDLFLTSRELNKLLSVPTHEFIESVERLQSQLKQQLKLVKKWQTQMAQATIKDMEHQLLVEKKNKIIVLDESDTGGDMGYLNLIATLIKEKDLLNQLEHPVVIVLASGEKQKGGVLLVLSNHDTTLKSFTTSLTSIMVGTKGGGARGRWNGKSTNFTNIDQLNDIKVE
ncbi:unnamed protein product [Cunninghamella echinulata]